MEILVISNNEINLGPKYQSLWDMLDGAKEAGIDWGKHLYNEKEILRGYDAYIFIDVDDPKYYGAPFILISSLEDGDDEVEAKVQLLASYMSGELKWDYLPTHSKDLDPVVIDIADLGYQITDEEVSTLTIKEFIVNIEGKEVKIPSKDLVTLGKVCNLMEKFGYKVKKVIV